MGRCVTNHGIGTYGYEEDYWAYGNPHYNLNDSTGKADWGYNAISNGGDRTNVWRKLTKDEWTFVLTQRSTESGKLFVKANVNDINGIMILPDNWDSGIYLLNYEISAPFSSNKITNMQWSVLEDHGAVFLPAAGGRRGTDVTLSGSYGHYWSSTCCHGVKAFYVIFNDNAFLSDDDVNGRGFGHSVRLVQDANK